MAYVDVDAYVTHVELGRSGPARTPIIDIRDVFRVVVLGHWDPDSNWLTRPALIEATDIISWEDIPCRAWP